jgi:hypothetical protein
MSKKPITAGFYPKTQRVYNAMDDAASDGFYEGRPARIWWGYTTHVFYSLGLPMGYYTPVFDLLRCMGCLVQLQRGGGRGKSQWALVQPPTQELFDAALEELGGFSAIERRRKRLLDDLAKLDKVSGSRR